MDTPLNNDSDPRLRARLALTGEREIEDWQKEKEYLEKRKLEAAKALASDEQKKIQAEKDQAEQRKIEAQKKLAELETVRRAEEELKKKDISAQQRDKDLAQEKLRQAKIKQILDSRKTIEGIRRTPQNQLSSIHTLTDDLSSAIKDKGFTATRLAQANRSEKKEIEKTVSWRKIIILTLSFVLVFGGLTAVSWSLWQRTIQSQVPAILTHDSIVFADEHIALDLKNKSPEQIQSELKTLSLESASTVSAREQIKDIYFVYEITQTTNEGVVTEKKIAGPTLFATSTGLIITDDLLRFLEPDFMLGLYIGAQAEPFYIFKTNSYKNSADALLHNENGIVSQLLSPFLDLETTIKIQLTPFQDKTIANRGLRLIIDQDNQTLALYTWLDQNTIAVTTNEYALEKVLNSFLTPKPIVK
ncbi:MAG: hypothetical protein WC531_02625 [Candidatus Paceibacterota bacterium]|jgi:hypothetical protein